MLRQDQQSGHGAHRPTESVACDIRRQPDLDVVSAQGLLDRGDFRLQFDHQKGACRRVPCQQVDGTAFSVDRERDFRNHKPSIGLEQLDQLIPQPRVSRIEKPIEVAPAPTYDQDEFGVEGAEDPSNLPKWHRLYPTAFEQRDLSLAHAKSIGHVALTQHQAMTQRPRDPTDPQVIHRESVSEPPSPPIAWARAGLAVTAAEVPGLRHIAATLVECEGGDGAGRRRVPPDDVVSVRWASEHAFERGRPRIPRSPLVSGRYGRRDPRSYPAEREA